MWDDLGWRGLSGVSDEQRLRKMAEAVTPRGTEESSTDFRTLNYTKHGSVCVIEQHRPHVLNARNVQMYWDLMAALEEAERDDGVVAVVLTGAGRYFCSGADGFGGSKKVARDSAPDPVRVRELKSAVVDPQDSATWPAVKFVNAFINFPKLLVGAVNGPAVGEGFSSLLHCDVVYAAETTTFWAPFHRFAVVPEFCSTVLLQERVGSTIANEVLMMSKKKTAGEMRDAGWVNEVLPAGEDFMVQVMAKVGEAIGLSGHPSVRNQSMQLFKGMMRTRELRERLMILNAREQELCSGWHGRDKAKELNLEHYAAQLPGGKK